MKRVFSRLWPGSMAGQMLLLLAAALFVAQAINGALLVRGQRAQSVNGVAVAASIRLIGGLERLERGRPILNERQRLRLERGGVDADDDHDKDDDRRGRGRGGRRAPIALMDHSPIAAEARREAEIEERMADVLSAYGIDFQAVHAAYFRRDPADLRRRMLRVQADPAFAAGRDYVDNQRVMIAAMQRPDGQWLVVRVPGPRGQERVIGILLGQTLILFIVLVVAVAFLLRRVTRPLAALTRNVEQFGMGGPVTPMQPSGPSDIAGLITAYNAMEGRIASLLDEKDVMLGAIGHDLKTPLAALRVRIESVDDDAMRARMAAGVEEINRSLDDILALARVGRPSEPVEPTNLSALVETLVEEFEDLGDPVTMADAPRLVASVRAIWIKRALRNLVTNAVRYGGSAAITLSATPQGVRIEICDDGPGIPDDQIERLTRPFERLEQSRNVATGGSGLGLTLARAIAEQHHGVLELGNRVDGDGKVIGFCAAIVVPV